MDLRVTYPSPDFFDCIDRVGWWRATQFAVVQFKSGFIFDCSPHHGQPHLPACGRRTFERRSRRRNQDHLFESEQLTRFARENQMSMMYRIEGTTVNADFHSGAKG